MGIVGQIAIVAVGPDHVDGAQYSAGVIPMPVGEDNRFDGTQVDAELAGVALERVGFRPAVEQQGAVRAAVMRDDQA